MIDTGNRVLALVEQRMRGRSTGIEVSFGKYAHLYTFRNGLIVHSEKPHFAGVLRRRNHARCGLVE